MLFDMRRGFVSNLSRRLRDGVSLWKTNWFPLTLRHAEGTAEWLATGPEDVVMSDGRSIRLPSAKFAQVREPGRNGPAFGLGRREGD